jgi:hypothetical protein
MDEDRDDAMMRSLFAEAPRPPMADQRFVSGVMEKVEARRAAAQAQAGYVTWAGVAAAALLFVTHGTTIVAELSRVAMTMGGPGLQSGSITLMLGGIAAGGAYLLTQRV